MTIFVGTIALPGTPISPTGEIDVDAYRHEIDWCLVNGAVGVMTAPSVGEFSTLSRGERHLLYRIGLEQVRNHGSEFLAMANVSAPSTSEAISYAREAVEMGYPALIMVPPWYWHCSEAEVFQHYSSVAQEAGLPLCVYNNPSLTGFFMTPDFVHRLLEIRHIEAVKETVTDLSYLHRLFGLLGDDPPVLHIHRAYLYSLVCGCKGAFMAPFTLRASIACREEFEAGNWSRAFSIQKAIAAVLPSPSEGSGGVLGMWKYASSQAMGIDLGPPKAPHRHPDEETQAVIRERLENLHRIAES